MIEKKTQSNILCLGALLETVLEQVNEDRLPALRAMAETDDGRDFVFSGLRAVFHAEEDLGVSFQLSAKLAARFGVEL